jgi:hypothetical protein
VVASFAISVETLARRISGAHGASAVAGVMARINGAADGLEDISVTAMWHRKAAALK